MYSNFYVKDENRRKIYLKFKEGTLPKGFITKDLIENYKVGILTVILSKEIFNYLKFKNYYNIIGDFDFIIRASLKFKIGCIQKPLACYRVHGQNFSNKKIKLYIDELKYWILQNKKLLKKKSLSLFSIRKLIIKLKVKLYLKLLGV